MTGSTWQQIGEAFGTALDLAEPERAAYLAGLPGDLRAEVESLLAAHHAVGDFLEEDDARDLAPGTTIGNYRVLRKAGEGGMGAIYLAQREAENFQHLVALKIIPPQLATAEVKRRFLAERRILASLEHPNIVRLFDGGEWEGRHYFAMEYVTGVPIHEYCAGLPIAVRLRMFRTVCGAIHYAHQHLIVHRDIKPNNVLVTERGEVKVLDFGIAKLLDAAPDSTKTAIHAMSLECASPEQVRQQPLTTASDVYSLGVLLYQLLSGVSPQGGPGATLDQVIRRICEETPQRPGVHVPGLPADLDSIVLRAMQKEPRLRYASADELSADIERFLAGDPVLAREATMGYVARKFVARHRLAVAAVAAGAFLVTAGAGVAVWQARTASRERAMAQRRFDETRKLARAVIFDLQQQLAQLPGALPVRQKMIQQTVTYLESMARDAGNSPELVLDIAGSYSRVGEIQGGVGNFNLGDSQGAAQSWRASLRLLDGLLAQHPDNAEALRLASAVHGKLAVLLGHLGQAAEVSNHYDEAVALAKRFQAASPGDPSSTEVLGAALFARAATLPRGDRQNREFQETLAVYEGILRRDPASANKMRNVALSCKYLADALLNKSEYIRALEFAQRARALDDARLTKSPGDRSTLLDLTNDLGTIGRLQLELGDPRTAIGTLRQNLEIRQRLAAADPRDALLAERLGKSHQSLGMALLAAGETQEARTEYQAALEQFRKALVSTPDAPSLQEATAAVQLGLAQVAVRMNRPQEACSLYAQSQALLLKLYPAPPRLPVIEREVQQAAQGLAACRNPK